MKVVVTGGSGQLGTLVLRRLIAARSVKRIVSLDLQPPAVQSPKLDWKIADVRDPGLDRHLEGADALVHLAFIVTRRASAELMHAVNVEGSQRMFEYAAQQGVGCIVYSSSIAAYGVVPGQPVPIVEDTPRQRSPLRYADNKYEVEAWLDAFEEHHPDLRLVRLRPAILIGRRMPHALGDAMRRRIMPAFGPARLPIVWDEDVADAVLLGLTRDVRGAFNLGADELLDAAGLARAGGMRLVRLPTSALGGAVKLSPLLDRIGVANKFDPAWLDAAGIEVIVSSERARAELGWKPRCPTAADVVKRYASEAPRRLDRRIAVLLGLVSAAGRALPASQIPPEARRMDLRVHLDITGPSGGDLELHVKRGRPKVARGIPHPPDTVVELSARTFLELMSGRTDLSSAQLSGKVKVRGEPVGAFVLAGMVTGLSARREDQGVGGFAARKLSRWCEPRTSEEGRS